MRKLSLIVMVLSAVSLAQTASASLVSDSGIVSSAVPVSTMPLDVIGGVPYDRGSTLLYSNTTQTGFRFNVGSPGPGGVPPADNLRRAFDDVPIPNARLGINTQVDVSRITVGIRRLAGAPATSVDIYVATLTTGPTPPDTELDSPGTLVCTANLGAAAASVTTLVTCGNGVNPFVTVPLNSTLLPGFGTMAVGVRLSSTDALNGWRLTSGPDANAGIFWEYDPNHSGQPNDEGTYNFGATPTNPAATFYIEVEGTPTPEPGTLAMLGLSLVMIARRRR